MGQLIPTAVSLEALIDITADINLFNDGVKTQAASPRTKGAEIVLVQVTDDPVAPAVATGVADGNVVNTLTDSTATFLTDGIVIGYAVTNTADGSSALVTAATETELTLGTSDIFPAGTEAYAVKAPTYWEQKFGTGEWQQSGSVDGNNKEVAYTLPVDGNTFTVHQVVYPTDLTDLVANPYPAK